MSHLPTHYNPDKDQGVWLFQEAKAKLSEVINRVQREGMQFVVRNRNEVYVIMSEEKFEAYSQPKYTLVDFFMNAPLPDVDIPIDRQKDLPREINLL